jgi:hypothetical protein
MLTGYHCAWLHRRDKTICTVRSVRFLWMGSAHSWQEVVEREYDEVLNIRRQMGGEYRPKQPRSLAQLAKDRRNHIDHCGTLL